ncbi:prostaglandin F2 receptor negative regulator-like [Sinocyclocheilus grahami]|uniref:prostaglandin F2 receptor negative regulator-like n=1 Tax=Sinocyclocheilus grahami TaxID=75366 RepID=UPI0007AD5F14|nr:PREDICTED: prostaglandin F2 receptor negative regulator-like [Sinocyclocheilus grahami]
MGKTRALILLCAALGLCHCRSVTVSGGPLLRVEGQPLSIRCDVSEYEGPREQDFEWTVTRGTETIKVISTFDDRFTDRSLQDRIRSDDISVSRLADNAIELRIQEARVSDSAIYRCSTPSTDSFISGNYEADVQLQVVPSSLIVAPDAPNPVVCEGRSIRLQCNVSRNFIEGIYLSLTWSFKKGSSLLEDLLTFGPDLGVTVGDDYMLRYTDGGMRLEMGNGVSHSLVLSRATPADQGMYVCTARLWMREQGIWNRIQEKTMEMGEVTVNSTANSLIVQVQDDTTLSTGETLLLTCSVSAEASVELEVMWLMNGTHVLAHLSRDGVLTNTSDVVDVRRLGKWDFQIKVHGVEMSDAGLYACKVSAWVQHDGGRWYWVTEKISDPVRVHVIKQNPDYTVVLSSSVNAKLSGDPTELECKVTNMSNLRSGRLGVSWLYRDIQPGDVPVSTHTIVSLDENGNLVPGKTYKSRVEAGLITVTRMEPYTFKLRLFRTTDADAGEYMCAIMAWVPSQHGNWKKVAEYVTPALKVSFANKRPVLGVVARRLREATAAGSTFEMSCQANIQNLPPGTAFSILILSEEAIGSPSRKLASLGPEMVLQLEDWGEPGRQDSLMLVKTGKRDFQFRIQAVQVTDRGFYSCEMKAWTKQPGEDWVEMAKGVSNKVQIAFTHKGPTFDLSISSDTTSVFPWETVKMECDVSVSGTSPTADDVAYEMKWFLSRLMGSNSASLLASMDRWGVVRKAPRNDNSDCSLERLGPRRFALNIHSTQDSDAGDYHCTATPWIRSTATGVWSKAPEVTSQRVFLNVKFALWDSMKLPLLYGICASVTVGVVSLVLGLVCAHCCCKTTTPTPRSHNKLMELEID